MNGLFFSTGRAARALGVTQAQIRALCQSKAIGAEVTDGGQWRVPKAEVERLKRDGLPPVALPLPADSSQPLQAKARYGHPALLAEPSGEVVAGAEAVAITESLLKKRKLERELEETEDWFREREREEAEQQAAEEDQDRLRLAREQDQRERTEWLRTSEQYALDNAPRDLPAELRLQLHQAVRARLAGLDPIPSREVTRRLVQSEIDRVAQPWKRRKEIARAVEEGRDSLPSQLRGWSWAPSESDIQAREAAAKAIADLRPDASYPEMRAAAINAVKSVIAAHQHQEGCKAFLGDLWHHLSGATTAERELAEEATRVALAELPVGTSKRVMEEVRDKVLKPLREVIAKRQAQQQAEQRQRQDEAIRQAVLTRASWELPWDLPVEERQAASAAVSTAIGKLAEGTQQQELEQAAEQALAPYLATHTQRSRKAELIDNAVRQIFAEVLELERGWDFEGKTAWTLEREIKEQIRKELEKQLTGYETPEQVARRLRRLVRETVGIERRTVYVKKAS